MALPVNYQDDILDTDENTVRKYTMTTNDDGTVSFEDATVYTQEGTTYSASITNAQNAAINTLQTQLSTISTQLTNVQEVQGELESAFQVGLEAVADALTSLGISTSATDSSSTFSTNLQRIATLYYNNGASANKIGNATASQVLSGYTFTNASSIGMSGNMTNYSSNAQTITASSSSGTVTYSVSAGYHTQIKVNQSAPYSAGASAGSSAGTSAGYSAGYSAKKSTDYSAWSNNDSDFNSSLSAAISYASQAGYDVSSSAASVLSAWDAFGSELNAD